MGGKPFWKSKGILWALLLILVGVANNFGFAEFDPTPQQLGAIAVVVGVITGWIRSVTTERLTAGG